MSAESMPAGSSSSSGTFGTFSFSAAFVADASACASSSSMLRGAGVPGGGAGEDARAAESPPPASIARRSSLLGAPRAEALGGVARAGPASAARMSAPASPVPGVGGFAGGAPKGLDDTPAGLPNSGSPPSAPPKSGSPSASPPRGDRPGGGPGLCALVSFAPPASAEVTLAGEGAPAEASKKPSSWLAPPPRTRAPPPALPRVVRGMSCRATGGVRTTDSAPFPLAAGDAAPPLSIARISAPAE